MREHLYLPKACPMPAEYMRLYLCRDVLHCAPSVLAQQSYADIRDVLLCLRAEQEHREGEKQRGR